MIAPPHKLYQRLALIEMLHLIIFLILCLSVIVVGGVLFLNVNPLELFNGKAPTTSDNDDNEEEDATHNYLIEGSVHDRDANITSFRHQQISTYPSAGSVNPPNVYPSPGGSYRPEANAHRQSWEALQPPHSYPAHTTRIWPPVPPQPQHQPLNMPFRSPLGNNIQGKWEVEKIMIQARERVPLDLQPPQRRRPSIHHPSTIRSPENPIRSLPITKKPRTFTPRTPNQLRWIYFKEGVSQFPYLPNHKFWVFAIPLSAIATVGRFMIAIVRFLIAAVLFVYCAAQRQPPSQGTTSVVVPETPPTLKEVLLEILRKMISSFFEKIYCFIDDVFVTQDLVFPPVCVCHCALGTHPATSEFLRKAPRIQNALQPQTGLEEKIDALIDLQSRIEKQPQEVEHRSIRSCAKPLVKQVQTAIDKDKEHGSQFAREHGQVLRFWSDMFLEIKPNQYLEPSTTTTTQETDSQPNAPSSLTSEPSSAVTTTSSNDSGTEGSEGQAAFIAAMSSTRVEGRSDGGDALRDSASGSQEEHMYGGECLRPGSDTNAGSPLSTLPCAFTFPGQFEVEVCDPADFGFESLMEATGDDDVEMGSESEDDELSARHQEVHSGLQQRKRKRGEDDCEVTESDSNSDPESDASTGRPQKRRRVDTDRSSSDEDRTRPKKLVKKHLRFHRSPFIRVFNKHSAAKFYVDEYVGPVESWTATPPPRRPTRRSVPGRLPKDHPYLQHYMDTRMMFNDEMMRWQSEGSRRKQRERLRDCGTVRRIFKYLTTEHKALEPES